MSDRYEKREKLGQGGLGTVYKAYDKQLRREVALKRVITPTQEALESLLHEATALSSLMHPNIVTVFDVGQDDEGGFVVMELLDGETLDDTIARAPLTLPDFAEVVNQTLEALIAAQAVNMTHRDLKPSNLMVIWRPSGRFQIKVLDFGLAKISSAPTPQTSDQEEGIMGSIYFMAPEQFERTTLDFRTDMYAMGCIYYYCLSGQYPFDGDTAPQVMMAHLHHLFSPLQTVRPDIPRDVADWVQWLMARDREDRPATAREALDRFPDLTRPTPVISGVIPLDGTVHASPAPPLSGDQGAASRPKSTSTTHALSPVGPRPPGAHRGGALRSSVMPKSGHREKRGGGGKTGSVSVATAAHVLPETGKKGLNTKTLIVIISSSVVGLCLVMTGLLVVSNKMKLAKEKSRIEALEKAPTGDATDVALLLRHLDRDPKAVDPRLSKILGKLRGTGIDDALKSELSRARPGPARMAILEVVANRPLPGTFPVVLDICRKTTLPEERALAVSVLSKTAPVDQVTALMGLLKTAALGEPERRQLEDGVSSILYRNGHVVGRAHPLLSELATPVSEGYRRSLARILGTLGGEAVLDRFLSQLLSAYPADLILALSNWPDRGCKDLLETHMKGQDKALKAAACRGYLRMLQMPSENPDDTAGYRLALETIDRSEAEQVYKVMVGNPVPQTLKFCKEAKIAGLESALAQTADRVQKAMNEAIVIKSGQVVPASKAQILGEDDGTRYVKEGDQIEWKSPAAWMCWVVKVEAPGSYEVSIVGSCPDNEGSEVKVTYVGTPLVGTTVKTGAGKSAESLTLGRVEIDASRQSVRRIFLSAGSVAQPGIMKVKGLRFTKK